MTFAAAIRIAHWLTVRDNPYLAFRVGDELHYHSWGRAIASGVLTGEATFPTAPLFPYYLGLIYRALGESIPVVLGANALLGVATVWLTWAAARRLSVRPAAALVAGLLVAFDAAEVFYESSTDKTTFVLFLAALAVFAIAVAIERRSVGAWLAAGLAVGVGGLGHPLLLMLLPGLALGLLLLEGIGRRTLAALATCSLGVALGVAPATLHNAVRGGELALVCGNGGIGLYLGNHSGNLTGLYTSPAFSRAEYAQELASFEAEAERRAGRALRPGEVSAFWTRQALVEMAAQPSLSIVRWVRRVRWSLGAEEITDTRNYRFYLGELPVLRLLPWGFGLVSVLGLVGAVATFRRRTFVLVALVLAYVATLSAFLVYGRYRLPLLVPLAILGGCAATWLLDVARGRRVRDAAVAIVAFAAASLLVFVPVLRSQPDSFFADYYNQGNRYLNAGQIELALAEYEKALTVRPGDHPAVVPTALAVSDMLVARGERARAMALLEAVLGVRAGDPSIRRRLDGLRGAGGR